MREFVDSKGKTWTAYEVQRQGMPRGLNDHLPQPYHGGWIVFEADGGRRKRRLAPVPADWRQRTDAELESLCRSASRVPGTEDSGTYPAFSLA